jgi:feruloyl esterase
MEASTHRMRLLSDGAARLACLAVIALAALIGPVQARAQGPAADTAQRRCENLRTADLMRIPDAPILVLDAKVLPASADRPAVCQVSGVVNGSVEVLIDLPTLGWNGKFAHTGSQFMHVGCTGAECGSAFSDAECSGPLVLGYACMVDDEGHKAASETTAWAREDLNAKVDYAFRATHLATIAGKAITKAYYGEQPLHAYFLGCSAAGRQGMIEAQRFPLDYDGMVIGAPPIHFAPNAMRVAWNAAALLGPDGRSLFPAAAGLRFLQPDLQLLHNWIVGKCDLNDGVKDGIIPDPRQCRYNLAELQCSGAKTPACLSADQIAAVRRVYDGPVDATGRKLSGMRPLPGSEGNWAYSYLDDAGDSRHAAALRADLIRNLGLAADDSGVLGPVLDWRADNMRLGQQVALYDAPNPDLRVFSRLGGKLIAFQGWSDHEVFPEAIIDYYETVGRTMGGGAAEKDFFRLFMIPGMDHCGNGGSADKIQYLDSLERWVEHGQAPDQLIAYQRKPTDDARYNIWPAQSGYWLTKPWDPAAAIGSRPVYPYPTVAQYTGKGDPSVAASWGPADPNPHP